MSSNSERQAKAQLESIIEMVKAVEDASGVDEGDQEEAREAALQTIYEDPLEVAVRSGWVSCREAMVPKEYMILLCTGGPAVRIVGDLDGWGQPESATLFHQDWGTPWIEYLVDRDQEDALISYARNFYFGEG